VGLLKGQEGEVPSATRQQSRSLLGLVLLIPASDLVPAFLIPVLVAVVLVVFVFALVVVIPVVFVFVLVVVIPVVFVFVLVDAVVLAPASTHLALFRFAHHRPASVSVEVVAVRNALLLLYRTNRVRAGKIVLCWDGMLRRGEWQGKLDPVGAESFWPRPSV